MRHYWKDDLTITPSIKQRQVFSDTSKKMLLCTARKTFKCVTGDTLVLDPTTGQRRRVDQLPEQTSVYAVGREGIVAAPALVRPNGRVAIYELITENGYRIKVSANHPFFVGGKLDKPVRFGDSHEKRTLYAPVEWREPRDIEAGHLAEASAFSRK